MAHYQGWNQEDLSRAGKDQEERRYIAPGTSSRPTSSFTSINHGHTNNFHQASPLTRTVEPLRTLRNFDIYDLQDDALIPTPGGIKRSKPCSKNIRAKTIPHLESSNNVGVEDHDLGQFEVSSPKRKKVPGQATQPAFKIPSEVPKSFGSESFQAISNDLHDGFSVPQLTTPPHTLKKFKKKLSSVMISKRKKSSELFQSSTITKPSLSYFTSKPPRDQLQSINRLQGFMTTEEQLKLNLNGIANTTLQKLATFKYVPRHENSSVNQSIITSQTPENHGVPDHYHDGQVLEESNHPLVNYSHHDHFSSDSFFEEALWIPKQCVDSNELKITSPNLSQIQSMPSNLMTAAMQQIPNHVEHSKKRSEYTPMSSEAGILESVLDDTAPKPIQIQNLNQESQSVGIPAVTQLGDMDPKSSDHSLQIPPVYLQSPITSAEQEQEQTSYDSTLFMPTARPGPYNTSIQVEEVEFGDGEPLLTNTFRDSFADDFDDDIDDEDLLALCTDNIVPEIHTKSHVVQTWMQPSLPSKQHQVGLTCTQKIESHYSVTLQPEVISVPSSFVVADEDDDFPMDADLEEEMLMLAGASRSQDVVESFVPPPSLRLPPDDDDTDREVYDNTLQFSSPQSREFDPSEIALVQSTDLFSPSKPPATKKEIDWGYITSTTMGSAKASVIQRLEIRAPPLKDKNPEELTSPVNSNQVNPRKAWLDDSHEYLPLAPFARPKFPPLVQDRCPVNGLSAQTVLRVCFRIGEMLKEGGRCNALGQDAIVELFARVNFSSREPGTTKQHFQFADLFHDRPPFSKGILANFKTTGLAESESRVFIESSEILMARCLGRVKKDVKNGTWLLHIINVRVTDWEEVRWTKKIVCGENQENGKKSATL